MATHRKDRVAEEIKKELSDIIRNEMKDPRVKGLVSVTHVEVSRDISTAVVFISSLGDDEAELDNMMKACKQAAGYLRAELANRLNLRFIPELSFRADRSIQTGARIHALINRQAEEMEQAQQQRQAMEGGDQAQEGANHAPDSEGQAQDSAISQSGSQATSPAPEAGSGQRADGGLSRRSVYRRVK